MPYEVAKDGAEYVCRKKGGKVLGRHKDKAGAEAQMRALYAAERRASSMKADGVDEAGELLIFPGDALKARDDDGRIGGYLVRWGSPDLPDRTATKDYFTDATAFGRFVKSPIDMLFHHNLPSVKGQPNQLADVVLGEATLSAGEEGLWLDGRLDLATPAIAELWNQIKADDDAFALSSGAVSHLVRRIKQDNGTHWVKTWPIVEASITPEPGELRTAVVALKSLIESDADGSDPEPFVESCLKAASDLRDVVARFAKIGPSKRTAIRELRDSLDLAYQASSPVDPAELAQLAEEADRLEALLASL